MDPKSWNLQQAQQPEQLDADSPSKHTNTQGSQPTYVFAVNVRAAEVRRLWFMNWQLHVPADKGASQIRTGNVFLFLFSSFVVTPFSNFIWYFSFPYQVFSQFTKTS